jgi:hypothetical protein
MIIYLYVKTHRKTGLKYLGKTEQEPNIYRGSGVYWTNHIKKHGYDVETEILRECQTKEELKEWGLYYTRLWNVVESDEWANMKPEEGDGGDNSKTDGYLSALPKMSERKKKCRWWNDGKNQVHAEFAPDDSYISGRLQFNNIGAKIGSEQQKNKMWITNGTTEIMIPESDDVPAGYCYGRICSPEKYKPKITALGTIWWNNGKEESMSNQSPGENFVPGRLQQKNVTQKIETYNQSPKICVICSDAISWERRHAATCSSLCQTSLRKTIAHRPRNR